MSNGNSSPEQMAEQPSQGTTEAADDKDRQAREKAEQSRRLQALKLMRARISEQLSRTSNSRYIELLNAELQQIDGELAKLV